MKEDARSAYSSEVADLGQGIYAVAWLEQSDGYTDDNGQWVDSRLDAHVQFFDAESQAMGDELVLDDAGAIQYVNQLSIDANASGDLVVYARGSGTNGYQSFSLWEIDQETQQSLLLDSRSNLSWNSSSTPFTLVDDGSGVGQVLYSYTVRDDQLGGDYYDVYVGIDGGSFLVKEDARSAYISEVADLGQGIYAVAWLEQSDGYTDDNGQWVDSRRDAHVQFFDAESQAMGDELVLDDAGAIQYVNQLSIDANASGDLVVYARGSGTNGYQSFSLWEIDQETQQSLLLDSRSNLSWNYSSTPFTFHSIPEWVNTFPELHLTAEVDAATGVVNIKTDWTGDVSAITYSVLVDGGQVVEYDLKDYPNEWLLAANFYNESSNAEVYLSATGSDVITGISDLLSMSVTPLSDTRDLRISLSPANISYAETPDIDDVLDREVSYTVKFGADVSALSATVSQMEGSESDTWIEYEIALDRAVDVDHELSWTLISTGSYGVNAADFEGNALPNGVVSFAAGETEGLIRFQVAADGMVEHDETFELVLTPSNGLNVSALGTLSGTLVNDDKAAVSVTGDSVLLPEGDSGITSYTFDVELDQAAFGEQSVDWAVELIDGEASLADFSGPLSGTVTFAEGETSKQITLGVVGDIEKEGREDFRIA